MGLKSKKSHNTETEDGKAASAEGSPRDADFSKLDGDEAAVVESAAETDTKKVAADAGGNSAKLTAELAEMKDKYLRSLAEFENFRKRSMKERSELLKYQGESILIDILEVLDSFERALEHSESDQAKLNEGIKLIHKQFVDALGKWEVRPDSAVGKEFDPMRHRAIGKAKVPGSKANTIIGELKKAYLYKDKLLRVGEVMVAEGESAPAEGEKNSADEGAETDDKEQAIH